MIATATGPIPPGEAVAPSTGAARLPGPLMGAVRVFATLWRNRKARIGLVVLAVIVFVAIFAPLLAPYSPTSTGFTPYLGPSGTHLFGTTGQGQDVFSQMLYGTRISLLVGLSAGLLATLAAVIIGLVAGYLSGAVDVTLSFITNLALVIPSLPLIIILAAYVPSRSVWTIVLVVAVTGWATGARVIRSQTSTLRSRDFVTAAVFSGERLPRIVFREILPNMTSLVAASFFGAATFAVMAEASLEFLGLGNPSTISWGTILYSAQTNNALLTGQWVVILAPGLAIALLALSFTLVNFGVDALSNPRLRERS
jgi:peptide/nickel transport system permease protein